MKPVLETEKCESATPGTRKFAISAAMRKCCIQGCYSNYGLPYIPIFLFPKEASRRKQWEKNINQPELKISKNIGVCVKHFDESSIIRFDEGTSVPEEKRKVKLKKDGVPTIFPHDPKGNEIVDSSGPAATVATKSRRSRRQSQKKDSAESSSQPDAGSSEPVLLRNLLAKPTVTNRPIITVLKAEGMNNQRNSAFPEDGSGNDDEEEDDDIEIIDISDDPNPDDDAEPEIISSSLRSKDDEKPSSAKETSYRKRRSSSVGSNSSNGSSDVTKSPVTKRRKSDKAPPTVTGRQNDCYCWVCHKEGISLDCIVCPRAYHLRCANETENREDWVCLECCKVTAAENIDNMSKTLCEITLDKFCMLLKCCVTKMKLRSPAAFHQPVPVAYYSSYLDYVIHPVDLSLLEKNIKQKAYGCTESFLADVKWILHNSWVFNGAQHPLTLNARSLVKLTENDMTEIEVCSDCFLHAFNRNKYWFSDICRKPHPLVWAKLKGFPYWPAKVARIVKNEIDARFFGAHDRAWVPVSQCFHLSKEMPTSSKPKKKGNYETALEELNIHVQILKQKYGSFKYAPYRTFYDPTNEAYMYHGIDIAKVAAKEEVERDNVASTSGVSSASGSFSPDSCSPCKKPSLPSDTTSQHMDTPTKTDDISNANAQSSDNERNPNKAECHTKKPIPSGIFEISKKLGFDIPETSGKGFNLMSPVEPTHGSFSDNLPLENSSENASMENNQSTESFQTEHRRDDPAEHSENANLESKIDDASLANDSEDADLSEKALDHKEDQSSDLCTDPDLESFEKLEDSLQKADEIFLNVPEDVENKMDVSAIDENKSSSISNPDDADNAKEETESAIQSELEAADISPNSSSSFEKCPSQALSSSEPPISVAVSKKNDSFSLKLDETIKSCKAKLGITDFESEKSSSDDSSAEDDADDKEKGDSEDEDDKETSDDDEESGEESESSSESESESSSSSIDESDNDIDAAHEDSEPSNAMDTMLTVPLVSKDSEMVGSPEKLPQKSPSRDIGGNLAIPCEEQHQEKDLESSSFENNLSSLTSSQTAEVSSTAEECRNVTSMTSNETSPISNSSESSEDFDIYGNITEISATENSQPTASSSNISFSVSRDMSILENAIERREVTLDEVLGLKALCSDELFNKEADISSKAMLTESIDQDSQKNQSDYSYEQDIQLDSLHPEEEEDSNEKREKNNDNHSIQSQVMENNDDLKIDNLTEDNEKSALDEAVMETEELDDNKLQIVEDTFVRHENTIVDFRAKTPTPPSPISQEKFAIESTLKKLKVESNPSKIIDVIDLDSSDSESELAMCKIPPLKGCTILKIPSVKEEYSVIDLASDSMSADNKSSAESKNSELSIPTYKNFTNFSNCFLPEASKKKALGDNVPDQMSHDNASVKSKSVDNPDEGKSPDATPTASLKRASSHISETAIKKRKLDAVVDILSLGNTKASMSDAAKSNGYPETTFLNLLGNDQKDCPLGGTATSAKLKSSMDKQLPVAKNVRPMEESDASSDRPSSPLATTDASGSTNAAEISLTVTPSSQETKPLSVCISEIAENITGDTVDAASLEKEVKELKDLLQALKIKYEREKWYHKQELNEMQHNMKLSMVELRSCLEADKKEAIEAIKIECAADKAEALEEIKSKQWCASCKDAAIFYCCWNTSYCSYSCQKHHWPEHRFSCTQIKSPPPLKSSQGEIPNSGRRIEASELSNSERKVVILMKPPEEMPSLPHCSENALPAGNQVNPSLQHKVQYISKNQLQLLPSTAAPPSSAARAIYPSQPVQIVLAPMKPLGDKSSAPPQFSNRQFQDSSDIITKVRSRQTNLTTAIHLINKMNKETEEILKKRQPDEGSQDEVIFSLPTDSLEATLMELDTSSEGHLKPNTHGDDEDEAILDEDDDNGPDGEGNAETMICLGSGVEINAKKLKQCQVIGTTPTKLVRCLLTVFFSMQDLAKSSVFGRKSNVTKQTRPALSMDIVNAILGFVMNKFPNAQRTDLVLAMNLKCKEARRKWAEMSDIGAVQLAQVSNNEEESSLPNDNSYSSSSQPGINQFEGKDQSSFSLVTSKLDQMMDSGNRTSDKKIEASEKKDPRTRATISKIVTPIDPTSSCSTTRLLTTISSSSGNVFSNLPHLKKNFTALKSIIPTKNIHLMPNTKAVALTTSTSHIVKIPRTLHSQLTVKTAPNVAIKPKPATLSFEKCPTNMKIVHMAPAVSSTATVKASNSTLNTPLFYTVKNFNKRDLCRTVESANASNASNPPVMSLQNTSATDNQPIVLVEVPSSSAQQN